MGLVSQRYSYLYSNREIDLLAFCIAGAFGLTFAGLIGDHQTDRHVRAREVFFWFLRRYRGLSVREIALYANKSDSAVYDAIKRCPMSLKDWASQKFLGVPYQSEN